MDYAQKCAENFESLKDEVIDKICERILSYHKFMLEEWNEEFVVEINDKVPYDIPGRDILKYIENPIIYIFPPDGKGIVYVIEGNREWEPEHGIGVGIVSEEVKYLKSVLKSELDYCIICKV